MLSLQHFLFLSTYLLCLVVLPCFLSSVTLVPDDCMSSVLYSVLHSFHQEEPGFSLRGSLINAQTINNYESKAKPYFSLEGMKHGELVAHSALRA